MLPINVKIFNILFSHSFPQYEPIFDAEESAQFVNKIVLYECQGNSVRLASMVREGGRTCDMYQKMSSVPCNSIVASWSRGSSVSLHKNYMLLNNSRIIIILNIKVYDID